MTLVVLCFRTEWHHILASLLPCSFSSATQLDWLSTTGMEGKVGGWQLRLWEQCL